MQQFVVSATTVKNCVFQNDLYLFCVKVSGGVAGSSNG